MTCQINEPDYTIVDLDHLVNAGGLEILRKLHHLFASIIFEKRIEHIRLWVRVILKKKRINMKIEKLVLQSCLLVPNNHWALVPRQILSSHLLHHIWPSSPNQPCKQAEPGLSLSLKRTLIKSSHAIRVMNIN